MRTLGAIACSIALGLLGPGCVDDADSGRGAALPSDASAPSEADGGSDDDAAAAQLRRWVGEVADSDIRLGIVLDDASARARVFFCGGPSSFASSTRWVVSDVDGEGEIAFDEPGWRVRGEVRAQQVTGRLELDDDAHDWSAAPVRAGTLAGLYEGQSDCGRVGLIVIQASPTSQPRAQGACVGPGHPPEQVNPILPVVLERGAIAVAIGDVTGEVRLAGPAP